MLYALMLAADPPPTPEGGSNFLVQMMPFLLIAAAFYFVMILPMRKQEKQRKALIAQLKKNDKIVNSGGVVGVVDSIKEKEDEVFLKGGVRITLSSIVKVYPPEEANKEQKGG